MLNLNLSSGQVIIMTREVEQTGKTVEEATEKAISELGVSEKEVDIQIIEEGSKGIFGLGAKQAKVRVIVKTNPSLTAEKALKDILAAMKLDISVIDKKEEDNIVRFCLGGESLGILIGRHGRNLDSLQFLVNIIGNKGIKEKKDRIRIVIDGEGYRERREHTLQSLAERMAKKAYEGRKNIVLEPMLPYERRIIHTVLQDNPYVNTYSQGDEPLRRVVIAPRK